MSYPDCIFTNARLEYEPGYFSEDYTQLLPDITSLCEALEGMSFDDLCRGCESIPLLVGASSEDWCLKEMGGVLYRERCVNPDAAGAIGEEGVYVPALGSYVLDPYTSYLGFPPNFIRGVGDPTIQANSFRVNGIPVLEPQPREIRLRVGISASPEDSNDVNAPIVWHEHKPIPLKLLTFKSGSQHRAGNTMPTTVGNWPFYRVGRVLYLEMRIEGTNGDVVLSGVSAEMGPKALEQ